MSLGERMGEGSRPVPEAPPDAGPPADRTTRAGCELCEAARFTHWYAADADCWVAECESCSTPMVVWWNHGTEPAPPVVERMRRRLGEVADALWGPDRWVYDDVRRQIPGHWHAHARRRWF